jgi:hypothetical protein
MLARVCRLQPAGVGDRRERRCRVRGQSLDGGGARARASEVAAASASRSGDKFCIAPGWHQRVIEDCRDKSRIAGSQRFLFRSETAPRAPSGAPTRSRSSRARNRHRRSFPAREGRCCRRSSWSSPGSERWSVPGRDSECRHVDQASSHASSITTTRVSSVRGTTISRVASRQHSAAGPHAVPATGRADRREDDTRLPHVPCDQFAMPTQLPGTQE